jgi:hypothetical protein
MLDWFVRLAGSATETVRGKRSTLLGCTSGADAACVRAGLSNLARLA